MKSGTDIQAGSNGGLGVGLPTLPDLAGDSNQAQSPGNQQIQSEIIFNILKLLLLVILPI